MGEKLCRKKNAPSPLLENTEQPRFTAPIDPQMKKEGALILKGGD